MAKLFDLVELQENNKECVILKVKDNKFIELLSLGCFDGDETFLRLTKGPDHTCTIFTKSEGHYDWHWGRGGYTLVTDKLSKKGQMIQNCIIKDFKINID